MQIFLSLVQVVVFVCALQPMINERCPNFNEGSCNYDLYLPSPCLNKWPIQKIAIIVLQFKKVLLLLFVRKRSCLTKTLRVWGWDTIIESTVIPLIVLQIISLSAILFIERSLSQQNDWTTKYQAKFTQITGSSQKQLSNTKYQIYHTSPIRGAIYCAESGMLTSREFWTCKD